MLIPVQFSVQIGTYAVTLNNASDYRANGLRN